MKIYIKITTNAVTVNILKECFLSKQLNILIKHKENMWHVNFLQIFFLMLKYTVFKKDISGQI